MYVFVILLNETVYFGIIESYVQVLFQISKTANGVQYIFTI